MLYPSSNQLEIWEVVKETEFDVGLSNPVLMGVLAIAMLETKGILAVANRRAFGAVNLRVELLHNCVLTFGVEPRLVLGFTQA